MTETRTSPPAGRQLLLFFGLAFGLAWPPWLLVLFGRELPTPAAFLFLFSPALAAVITIAATSGLAGLRELAGRFRIVRFGAGWYLLALGLMPVIFLVAAAPMALRGAAVWTGQPWYFVVASFGYLMFITSGEEIGWRGFALGRLQDRIGNVWGAALALGLLWGLWHLPLYLIPGQSSFPLPLFLLFTAGASVLSSLLYNHTQGSLVAAVLLHASTDIMPRILQIANFTAVEWTLVCLLTWALAVLLIFWVGGGYKASSRRTPS